MFMNLLKGLLAGFAVKVLENYRQLSVQLLKIETAKACVQGVQLARLSTLALLRLSALLGLIALGVVLCHVGVFLLLPWSLTAKAVLALILGVLYALAGGLLLRISMTEKTWLERSGANGLLLMAVKDVVTQDTENHGKK